MCVAVVPRKSQRTLTGADEEGLAFALRMPAGLPFLLSRNCSPPSLQPIKLLLSFPLTHEGARDGERAAINSRSPSHSHACKHSGCRRASQLHPLASRPALSSIVTRLLQRSQQVSQAKTRCNVSKEATAFSQVRRRTVARDTRPQHESTHRHTATLADGQEFIMSRPAHTQTEPFTCPASASRGRASSRGHATASDAPR